MSHPPIHWTPYHLQNPPHSQGRRTSAQPPGYMGGGGMCFENCACEVVCTTEFESQLAFGVDNFPLTYCSTHDLLYTLMSVGVTTTRRTHHTESVWSVGVCTRMAHEVCRVCVQYHQIMQCTQRKASPQITKFWVRLDHQRSLTGTVACSAEEPAGMNKFLSCGSSKGNRSYS